MNEGETFRLLLAFARAHEAWEGKLIASDPAWQKGEAFPQMTEELWDEAIRLQAMRNEALRHLTRDQGYLF